MGRFRYAPPSWGPESSPSFTYRYIVVPPGTRLSTNCGLFRFLLTIHIAHRCLKKLNIPQRDMTGYLLW